MPKPRSAVKLAEMMGYTGSTLFRWCRRFNWDERAAAWDKHQIEIMYREDQRLRKNKHREAIQAFRDTAEKQAQDMLAVSEDLTSIVNKRVQQAIDNDEEIPMNLVAGLLRATAAISEQGRQSWAAAIGVDQLMEVVEAEVQAAERQNEQKALDGAETEDGEEEVFEFELDE